MLRNLFATSLLGLAMEGLLTYWLYTETLNTDWAGLTLLGMAAFLVQLIYFCWKKWEALPEILQKLSNVGNGATAIVLVAIFTGLRVPPDQTTLIVYGVIIALGLLLMLDGLIYTWGWPTLITLMMMSLARIGLGVWCLIWHAEHGRWMSYDLFLSLVWLGINIFGIWCVTTGVVRLFLSSGLTAVLITRARKRRLQKLMEELEKQNATENTQQKVYGDGELKRNK